MLLYFVDWLRSIFGEEVSWIRLFSYISFRAGAATIISLVISLLFGRSIIDYLRRLQVGETIRDLGLEGQKEKEGTPTMGGIIIIMAILIPTLLLCKLDNIYVVLMIVATSWMGIIGFLDDYIKVFGGNKAGLHGWFKVCGQVGLGIIVATTMIISDDINVRLNLETADSIGLESSQMIGDTITVGSNGEAVLKGDFKTNLTNVPFLKGNRLDYARLLPMKRELAHKWVWILFVPLVIIVVTAVSNGANLTDGLDGLATGVSGVIAATLVILAYLSSNAITANYLNILHLPGTDELVIFASCFVGACIGFLWYNAHPAQIFMGDTGSLTIGGIIATLAILLRKELLIPLLCGIFLVETLSVVLQVSYFKYTRRKFGEGRRIFLMSPLHHHYQKKGMAETKIVLRFWIVGILLAVITLITLKIR